MTFTSWLYGGLSRDNLGGGESTNFGELAILISDVADVRRKIVEAGLDVEIRTGDFELEPGEPLDPQLDLEHLSDPDLEALFIIGKIPESELPTDRKVSNEVVRVTFGSRKQGHIIVRRIPSGEGWSDDVVRDLNARLDKVRNGVVEIVQRRGRRRIPLRRRLWFAPRLVVVVVLSVYGWFCAATRPPLATAVLVGLLTLLVALLTAYTLSNGPLQRMRTMAPHFGAVRVLPRTLVAWRERRWNTKRDIWLGLATFVGGVGSALLTAWLTGFLRLSGTSTD